MRRAVSFACGLAFALCLSAAAQEQKEHVAVVEEISPGVKDVQRFDMVVAERAIELGKDDHVVLGYLKSCWQDSVTGGRVIVESQKSRVEGGALTRRRVECDAAGLSRMNSTGLAARGGASLTATLPEPDLHLYGRSPVIIALRPGTLLIERLDASSAPVRVELPASRLDLSERNIALEAGGLYRFSNAETAIVVQIDGVAETGRAPVVGRLVIFR